MYLEAMEISKMSYISYFVYLLSRSLISVAFDWQWKKERGWHSTITSISWVRMKTRIISGVLYFPNNIDLLSENIIKSFINKASSKASSDKQPQSSSHQNITLQRGDFQSPRVSGKYRNNINESIEMNERYGSPDENHTLPVSSKALYRTLGNCLRNKRFRQLSCHTKVLPVRQKGFCDSSVLRRYDMHQRLPHYFTVIRIANLLPASSYTARSSP